MKIEPVVQKISVDKLSSNTILDRNEKSLRNGAKAKGNPRVALAKNCNERHPEKFGPVIF